jgi:acyl carrier protein
VTTAKKSEQRIPRINAGKMEMRMRSTEESLGDILLHDLSIEREKDKILPTDSFRRDLGLDSLGFVELKTQVEIKFGIVITDDDFTPENFATISSLASLIDRCRSAQ